MEAAGHSTALPSSSSNGEGSSDSEARQGKSKMAHRVADLAITLAAILTVLGFQGLLQGSASQSLQQKAENAPEGNITHRLPWQKIYAACYCAGSRAIRL